MLQYLIKFSISLAVLYIFYRAILRPLTFYQCNRFYLLCYSLLSFVIPFINIAPWVAGNDSSQLVNIIPAISNYNLPAIIQPADERSWLQRITITEWLIIVFCLGAVIMLVKLIMQYLSLRRIRQAAVLLETSSQVQLYETTAAISPFSFGNAIYFNRQLHTGEELQRIIQHEFVHVKQKHTIDLLVGELLCVVNWFNPFAWFIRYSIRQNLEFIADNNVVANGIDKKEYQYLLLKVVGVPQYSIANNFNFSNLKKRIAMMNKMKTSKLHLTRFLFVLPLMAVLFLAFRKNDNEITGRQAAGGQATDTIPGKETTIQTYRETMAPANSKGYIVTIADNRGECIVLVKDKDRKIIKAMTLVEWNSNKKENENQYGEIPPPPPPPLAPGGALAPVVVEDGVLAPPPPPVPGTPQAPYYVIADPSVVHINENLPDNVSQIVIENHTDKKSATKTNIATVTLKNGKKEVYNLNNPEEKARFTEKYGAPKAIEPVPPVGAPAPVRADVLIKAVNAIPANAPLFVIDGIERPDIDISDANALPPNSIKVMNVLKGNNATIKYGDKGKNGVIEITTRPPLYIVDSIVQPPAFKVKTIDPVKIQSVNVFTDKSATGKYGYKAMGGAIEIRTKQDTGSFPKDVLVIIDGKEIPAGAKADEYVKTENIESMHVLSGKEAIDKYGEKGKHGVIEIKTKKKPEQKIETSKISDPSTVTFGNLSVDGSFRSNNNESIVNGSFTVESKTAMPLLIIDNKEIYGVHSFTTAKGNYKLLALNAADAIAKYGSKAKYGALEIKTL